MQVRATSPRIFLDMLRLSDPRTAYFEAAILEKRANR